MSWVYFIRAGKEGPIKIGCSRDPKKRLASLQTANPVRLTLIGAYCVLDDDPFDAESDLHALFHRERIGESEWFCPSRALVRLAQSYGPATCDRCQGVVTSAEPPLNTGPCFECCS